MTGRWQAVTRLAFASALLLSACAEDSVDDPLAENRDAAPDVQSHVSRYPCKASSDCVVVPQNCCASCSGLVASNALAMSRSWAGAYLHGLHCEAFECDPRCTFPPSPHLVATCANEECELVDLSARPFTECRTASDCRLRTNACCECGGATGRESLVAVARDSEQSVADWVCEPNATCDSCAAEPPPDGARAECIAERCRVAYAPN